ncbi:MAG: hypothetical protein ACRD20_07510 [Terriglobales bacterium]
MNVLKMGMGVAIVALAVALTPSAIAQNTTQNTTNDRRASSTQGMNNEPSVLVDPAKIYNENPMGWVRKSVVLQNVTVQDTNDSGNFWVGSDNDHRLLVVKTEGNDTLKVMRFHKGDVVTISGTVEAASRYKADTTSADSGSMHDAQKTTGVFLQARDITVSSSTHK